MVQSSWLVIGDFNEILRNSEKKGKRERPLCQMRAFQQTLDDCELRLVKAYGYPYTWARRYRDGEIVEECLDRCGVNEQMRAYFHHIATFHLTVTCSDHLPIVGRHKSRRFLFEQTWCMESSCEELIKVAWDSNMSLHATESTKVCYANLVQWNKCTFGHVQRQLKKAYAELESLLRHLCHT